MEKIIYTPKKNDEYLHCGYDEIIKAIINSDNWWKPNKVNNWEKLTTIPSDIEKNMEFFNEYIYKIILSEEEFLEYEKWSIYEQNQLIKNEIKKIKKQKEDKILAILQDKLNNPLLKAA